MNSMEENEIKKYREKQENKKTRLFSLVFLSKNYFT